MKPLLEVLQGKALTPPPLWLMRQAGRYLPEYRETRQKAGSFLDLCYNPDLASEVTLQPITRYGFDAAILFSDILIVPQLLGQQLTFVEGEGPKLGPLDIDGLETNNWREKAAPIFETIRKVKSQLPEQTTLIGFAGSPWTVACYMIEGGSSENFEKARSLARANPARFEKLIDWIIAATLEYIEGQIEAGAEVIQFFDSWAGKCDNVQRWVIEPTAALCMILHAKYPKLKIIGFPRLLSPQQLVPYAAHTGVNGLSLDPHIDMEWAATTLPRHIVIQGNLDPALLKAGGKEMKEAAEKIITQMKGRAFIFNLGHGIDKETPPENVAELVKIVRGTK